MSEQQKMKLYCALGAEQFQKAVFALEKMKFQIIEKCFPNIVPWYEKQCDRQFLKRIKKEKVEDKQPLLNEYQREKLAFRREMVYKQNRNYHYNPNYPTKFIKYLEMNKKIHQRGVKKNIIALIGIGIISLAFGNPFPVSSVVITLFQILSIVINFQCINLQNYNICRFQNERMKKILTKMEETKTNSNLKKLGEGVIPISKAMNNQIEIPTIDEVIDKITSRTQAKQLLEYTKEQLLYLKEIKSSEENKQTRRK